MRDLFVWIIHVILLLILGFLAFFVQNQVKNFLLNTLFFNFWSFGGEQVHYDVVGILFSVFFGFATLVNLFLFFNIIIFSKKRSLNDHYSNSVVVNLKDCYSDTPELSMQMKKTKKPQLSYNMPGEINTDAILEEYANN